MNPKIERIARTLSGKALSLATHQPEGKPHLCHNNVAVKVQQAGGQQVYGWVFQSSRDGRVVQAVWHSVWRSPEGNLYDLTPTEQMEREVYKDECEHETGRVVFLEADVQSVDGGRSRCLPLVNNPIVKRFCRRSNQFHYAFEKIEARSDIPLWPSLFTSQELLALWRAEKKGYRPAFKRKVANRCAKPR